MKVIDATTTTYDMGDGFCLDIVQRWEEGTVTDFEAWIHHEDYAVKNYMFGCPNIKGFGDFVEMAVRNYDEYKDFYNEEVIYRLPFN